MQTQRSVAAAVGYVVTEKGRRDRRELETCSCEPRLFGLLIECTACGTVFGSIRDNARDAGRSQVKRRWD